METKAEMESDYYYYLLKLIKDAEEFLNNKYNIGNFNIDIETCDIYLAPFGYTNKKISHTIPPRSRDKMVLIKVGRLIPKSLTIEICIPIKKRIFIEIEPM